MKPDTEIVCTACYGFRDITEAWRRLPWWKRLLIKVHALRWKDEYER